MPSLRHLESSHGHRPTASLLTPSSACPAHQFVKQDDQSPCHTPVIPACAGNTAIYYLPVHSGVHPRTGGEHDSNLTRPPVTFRGASPCVGALGARPFARDPVPLAYPRIGGAGALRFFPLWDFPRLLRSRAAGVRRLRRRRHRARSSGAVVCAGRQREPCPGSRRKRIPRKEGRRWRHPDTHCLDELESSFMLSFCFPMICRYSRSSSPAIASPLSPVVRSGQPTTIVAVSPRSQASLSRICHHSSSISPFAGPSPWQVLPPGAFCASRPRGFSSPLR